MNTKKNRNIGLVGLGYWGKNILRNLHELGVLRIACDNDAEIIRERKKEFASVTFTSKFKEILTDPEIHAVAISSPAVTHYKLVKEALKSGKDVFVEKPLALTLEQGAELTNLAKKEKKILMVGHILQYHPAVIKLKEMIEKGELGKIQYIYSNRLNMGKLRTEENILWSFAPHDISVILMLVGDEPVKVSCFGEDYLNEGVCDITLSTLEFKNKIKAHIFVSWLHPFKEQKLIVVGSKAMAVFDDLSQQKLSVYPHRIEWEDGKIPVAYKAEHYDIKIESKEPLKEELRHFLECIQDRCAPKTDGEEGLKVLRILEEAEKNIQNKSDRPKITVASERDSKYFVHPSSLVDQDVEIGEGTMIWHFSHVLNGSRVGKNCRIGQNVVIGPRTSVGNGCKIQNNVSIYEKVTLEDGVFCGPSCVFTNVYNPRAFIERKHEFLSTLVKKGATIGANATIVCGHTLGKYCMVGAGAVVKKDVPDYALVVGVPARQIGYVCRCGVTLKFAKDRAKCDYCGNGYARNKSGIEPTTSAGK
jgi:UDP-2-acetamido-3-amino-2,3-dideoxy-glucuronate N-acetyltransferase